MILEEARKRLQAECALVRLVRAIRAVGDCPVTEELAAALGAAEDVLDAVNDPAPRPVLQPWVQSLSLMQQSVLLTSLRGPDGIRKDHISKLLIRWLRRCVLISAFDGAVLDRPYDLDQPRGGSFTGPSISILPSWEETWPEKMFDLLKEYLRHVDELPHHFQLHFMHAAEILGFKHPVPEIRLWWKGCYHELVNDAHLHPETEAEMDKRLGDNEANWRARESVVARAPGEPGAAP